MTERPVSNVLRHVFPDALVALALFLIILVLAAGDTTAAAPSGYVNEARASIAGMGDRHTALMLLAGVFSVLVTLNLAFFRHLLRAYAAPRRTPRPGVGRSVLGERR